MNCVHCGTNLPDNATFCTACGSAVAVNPPQTPFNQYSPTGQGNYGAPGTYGQPGDYRPPPPKIPNYLIWSIFSTICCCLPLGIAAIIFSVQSQSALTAGNFAKAAQDSKTAFYCNLISLIGGLIINIIVFTLSFAQGYMEAVNQNGGF